MTIDMDAAMKLFKLASGSVGSYVDTVSQYSVVFHRIAVHFNTSEEANQFQSLVAAIATSTLPKPKLETVDEHNARRRIERRQAEEAALRTGVACPKCGKELRRKAGDYCIAYLQYPPVTAFLAICAECKMTVELED